MFYLLPLLISFASCCCPHAMMFLNTKPVCVENEVCNLSDLEFLTTETYMQFSGEKSYEKVDNDGIIC